MKKPELNKTKFLLIVLGVIVAIIISLQTSAFSFQHLDKVSRIKAITESPKNVISHAHDHIIQHFFITLKNY